MGVFRFPGGKLAYVHASWTEWAEYMYAEVYGTDGFLRIDCRQPVCELVVGARDGKSETLDFSEMPQISFAAEVDDFVTAVLEGRQPTPSGFDGMRAVQMAHGVYRSARTGHAQPLWGPREQQLLSALKEGGS